MDFHPTKVSQFINFPLIHQQLKRGWHTLAAPLSCAAIEAWDQGQVLKGADASFNLAGQFRIVAAATVLRAVVVEVEIFAGAIPDPDDGKNFRGVEETWLYLRVIRQGNFIWVVNNDIWAEDIGVVAIQIHLAHQQLVRAAGEYPRVQPNQITVYNAAV
jgi:hypothetical protein